MRYTFFVPGLPGTAGSKSGFGFKRPDGSVGVNMVDSCKRKDAWRAAVQAFALQAGVKPIGGPVTLRLTFSMPRPKQHHIGSDRAKPIRANAPKAHTGKPDVTKMVRAVEDALKGIAWHDDSQVVYQENTKHYADEPGATVQIEGVA
ncbi:MAG: RusA family crossover junction endodeoxyribonuclease [Phycisphaeraceae bacterium]|nr:RusA family crossover junction endodeoxyribonuclease [Phycisphaeraceae bacterium]